jgi:hypothetical protein
MKRNLAILCLLFAAMGAAFAVPTVQADVPTLPKILNNARFVYVTSYDGGEWNPDILPEDRQAIATVQEAMQKWGKFIVVDQPAEADIVLMVMSRRSEDVLAVYQKQGWPGNDYLWRVMRSKGLQENEAPLVTEFEQAFENASKQ